MKFYFFVCSILIINAISGCNGADKSQDLDKCKDGVGTKFFQKTPYEELCNAVMCEDLVLIESLLKNRNLDVNYRAPVTENSLLHIAVSNNKVKSARKLLGLGIKIDGLDHHNESALMAACFSCSIFDCSSEMVELLLEYGADVNEVRYFMEEGQGYLHDTPLMQASSSGCLNIVKILVENGADVNKATYHPGYGAITCSIIHHYLEVTKYLIIDCKAEIPGYCYIREGINGNSSDSISVIDFLNEDNYESEPQNERYRKEIIGYIESQVDLK